MARFRKDALYAGDWHLPDGRVFKCSPAEVSHYRKRAKDMLAAGLSIPVCLSHQDVTPMTASERLALRERNTVGWVEDAHDSGPLEFDFEVPDDEDARRLPAIRFVSPEIQEDFVDGTGRKWPGKSITHLAVTSRPVQTGQRPFTRLSHDQRPIRLGLEGWRMAEDTTEPDGDENMPEASEDGAGVPCPPSLIEALKGAGLTIPDECTDIKHLVIAIKANGKGESGGEDEPGDDQPADTAGNPVEGSAAAAPPVALSLDASERTELETLRREKTERQIKDLKSVDRVTRDKMLAEFGAVRMGETAKRADFMVKLKAYQDLPPLAINAGPHDRLSLEAEAKAVPNPADADDAARLAAIQKDIDERAARMSVRTK